MNRSFLLHLQTKRTEVQMWHDGRKNSVTFFPSIHFFFHTTSKYIGYKNKLKNFSCAIKIRKRL